MPEASRLELIQGLQRLRSSKVICYLTSDRQPPWAAQMAIDVIRPFFETLRKMGKVNAIDLFIFSQGGDTLVPWRIVTLARQFCKKLNVLVPYRAHSAATMLALGADEIVMGPLGELSPIDPTITTPFNPPTPGKAAEQKILLSVEDVAGYLSLARERAGITNQDTMARVFEKLSDSVHPLAIGSIYRSHALIRLLAGKLLAMHPKDKRELERIPRIVELLAEKLYAHGLLIDRHEAAELGLAVKNPSAAVEESMWSLFESFEKEMKLKEVFTPPLTGTTFTEKAPISILESETLVSSFTKTIHGNVVQTPAGPQITLREEMSGWVTTERTGAS